MGTQQESKSKRTDTMLSVSAHSNTSSRSSFSTRDSSKLNLSVRFMDEEDNDNDTSNFSQRLAWKSSPLKTHPSFVTRRSSYITLFDKNGKYRVDDDDDDNDNDNDNNNDIDENYKYKYNNYDEDRTFSEGKRDTQQQQRRSTAQLLQHQRRSVWESSSNSIAPPLLVERRVTLEHADLVHAATEMARLFDIDNDNGHDTDNDNDDDRVDNVGSTRSTWKPPSSLTYYPTTSKGDKPPSFVCRRLSNDGISSFIDTKGNNDFVVGDKFDDYDDKNDYNTQLM